MTEIPSQEGREFHVLVSPLQRDIRYNREFWRGKKMFSILSPLPFHSVAVSQSDFLPWKRRGEKERFSLIFLNEIHPSLSFNLFSFFSISLHSLTIVCERRLQYNMTRISSLSLFIQIISHSQQLLCCVLWFSRVDYSVYLLPFCLSSRSQWRVSLLWYSISLAFLILMSNNDDDAEVSLLLTCLLKGERDT